MQNNKNINKMQKIEIGTEVRFIDTDGLKVTGTVTEVKKNTYTVTKLGVVNTPYGLKCTQNYYSFRMSGKPSHHRYLYGEVVEIIGKIS